MENVYERRRVIRLRDCDMFRRIRPSAVLALFQDCSEDLTEGWGVGLEAMLRQNIIWVCARAACTVTRLPVHGQTVTVRGWAGRSRTGICPFHYRVLDDSGGEELIRGCAMWVLSDLETHSMMSGRIPRLNLPTPEPEGTPLPRLGAIAAPETHESTSRRVLFSETDINGHLTNTRYVDWVCDLVPAEVHRGRPMRSLRVDYRAESFPGEEVPLDWALTDKRLWCASRGRFAVEIGF